MGLFKPWLGSSRASPNVYTDQVDALTRFIGQTAKSLAFMGQLNTKSYYGYRTIGRSDHLKMLCETLRELALLPQVGRASLDPDNFTTSHRACFASPSPFVPIKRHEILREWRLIQSDVDFWLGRCNYCRCYLDRDQRLRVCTVCSAHICNDCYSTIINSTPRSLYLQPFKILLQLERETSSVLNSLEAIATRTSEVLRRVLSQNDVLEYWVYSQKRAYSDWKKQHCEGHGLRVSYSHFLKTDFIGWNAIDVMARCLTLKVRQCPDLDLVGPNGKDTEDPWNEVTQLWQNIYAFEYLDEELYLPCTHRRFLELTPDDVCSIDGHLIHDSSGQVSFEVFEALAKKYEDSGKGGSSTMEDLQSTRVSDWLFGGRRTETGLNSLLMIPERLRDDGDTDDGSSSVRSVSTGSSGTSESGPVSATRSESGSGSESVNEKFEDAMESEGISEDWIEDLLDNLLEKFKNSSQEALDREETELVLETAWKMGQAIVYHDTPRPSLKEISEQNIGFHTAPASPLTSSLNYEGSDRSLTMFTARSISPVSWPLEDDTELEGSSHTARSISPISWLVENNIDVGEGSSRSGYTFTTL